jgi:protein-tyrosine phosphatase
VAVGTLQGRALAIAETYLGGIGDRWTKHDQAVIHRARDIQHHFGPDGELLIAAAILHDIGVAPDIPRLGMSGLNAGRFLRAQGFPDRLTNLVANASCASIAARLRGLDEEFREFTDEQGVMRDALLYCCLTNGPDGTRITFEEREHELLHRLRHDAVHMEHLRLAHDVFSGAVARTEARIGISQTVLSRVVHIPGLINVRDVGGLRAGTRQVLSGILYRSEAPIDLDSSGLESLSRLDLNSVIDLRGQGGGEFVPTSLPGHVRRMSFPIPPPLDDDGDGLLEQVLGGKLSDYSVAELGDMYIRFLELHARSFGAAVGFLADPVNLPCLVHCSAGKDRTGVLVALVLGMLGVSREDILEDYESTTHFRAHRAEQLRAGLVEAGTSWDRVEPLFGAPRAALAIALDHIGDPAEFLVTHAGVPQATIDRLRRTLIADVRTGAGEI